MPNILYSTGFDGGNENPLSESGKWNSGYGGNLQIVSNRARIAAVGTYSVATFTGSASPDQMVEWTVPTWNAASAGTIAAPAIFRAASPATNTWYELDVVKDTGASPRIELWKVIAGSATQIGSSITIAVTGGDRFRAWVDGFTFYCLQNSTQIAQFTDTTQAIASGLVGFAIYVSAAGAGGDVEVDTVSVSNVATPRLVQPLRPRIFAPGLAR